MAAGEITIGHPPSGGALNTRQLEEGTDREAS